MRRVLTTLAITGLILAGIPGGVKPVRASHTEATHLDGTTGLINNFFGFGAGDRNPSGQGNSFFGGDAGKATTTGCCNSFFGQAAGRANESSGNSFFGDFAGQANVEGGGNSFFGQQAGLLNTSGSANSFFGAFVGRSNVASHNSFFGESAGEDNTSGADNAFFGRDAGTSNLTGSRNSFFGSDAGRSNTTGGSNAFFGREAGLSNTTEHGNSFFGAFSNGVAGITNATAVGHQARVSRSDSIVLGSIAGLNGAAENARVGIGTDQPVTPLHVRRTDGTAKVFVEEGSATTLGRTLFQLTNNGASRFRITNTQNNATWDFQTSGGGGSFVIDRVGGDPSLDFELQPDGDLVLQGTATASSFITSSDRNRKTDITPANARKLMALLSQLDISTWRFKDQPEGTINLGPMAQDFHRLFGMGTDTTIDVRDLAALALVAAQTFDAQNAEQLEINEDLQAQIDELRQGDAG